MMIPPFHDNCLCNCVLEMLRNALAPILLFGMYHTVLRAVREQPYEQHVANGVYVRCRYRLYETAS